MVTNQSQNKPAKPNDSPQGSNDNRANPRIFKMKILKRIGKIFGVAYLAICSVLWSIQGFFVFHPIDRSNSIPTHSLVEYEVVVDESKGITARGYIVNPTAPGPVILFFTGNAGDALSYVYIFENLDFKVPAVLSNYRGYGKSDGQPSEKTILSDAKVMIQMVRERYPDRPLVLMGSSLGSAVAIRTADSNVAGVILISPFRSLAHVANRSLLRIFPVHFLMRHKFDTRATLGSLPDRVLVIYSRTDTTISSKETERVLEKIPQAEIIVDRVHHNAILHRSKNLQSISRWLEQNFKDV